ncbi:MAG: hypothetical protein H7A08_04185 [Oceanospirillaceae bacterium]|nr:hypothetical protein [Oceanospirillaceae bacterium]MCP5349548.1 hypothetical protein [Oceanospirillaceae bacterium]
MQNAELNMIQAMVQQIMIRDPDVEEWRRHLVRQQLFTGQEARELNEREVTLLYRTLLTYKFQRMNPKALTEACERYQIYYMIDLDDSIRAAAVGY